MHGEQLVSHKGRETFGESAGDKDTDCQKWKAGDGGVCAGGLEGMDVKRIDRIIKKRYIGGEKSTSD